jgi:hypothetical protein
MIAEIDPVSAVLIQYGAVGALAIIALAAARVMFNRMNADRAQEIQRLTATLERETQRADRLEAELRSLNEAVRGQYLDTISKSSEATAAASRAVADALAAVRRG